MQQLAFGWPAAQPARALPTESQDLPAFPHHFRHFSAVSYTLAFIQLSGVAL
jgi:hypothetical protein